MPVSQLRIELEKIKALVIGSEAVLKFRLKNIVAKVTENAEDENNNNSEEAVEQYSQENQSAPIIFPANDFLLNCFLSFKNVEGAIETFSSEDFEVSVEYSLI